MFILSMTNLLPNNIEPAIALYFNFKQHAVSNRYLALITLPCNGPNGLKSMKAWTLSTIHNIRANVCRFKNFTNSQVELVKLHSVNIYNRSTLMQNQEHHSLHVCIPCLVVMLREKKGYYCLK